MAENSALNSTLGIPEHSQRLCGLLAIETSGSAGSVAWAEGTQVRKIIPLDPNRRTAATLTAALGELLAAAGESPRRIDVVAVANGPGSFTGLRIGVTAAKMLAYALQCPLVAVDTLAAMAGALWQADPRVEHAVVAINAYRQQVFAARWSRRHWEAAAEDNTLAARSGVRPLAEWQQEIAALDPTVTVAADPAVVRALLRTAAPIAASKVAAVQQLWPDAGDVARLGLRLARGGHYVSPWELKPNYLRDSAAEEKLR